MLHARKDYNRIQDPALQDPSLLSEGSSPIAEDEPVFLVRASDQAFVPTLNAWIDAHLACYGSQVMTDAVKKHIRKAVEWQKKNRYELADAPVEVFSPNCPYPNLHSDDCDCQGMGGPR